ncbi:MAG: glycosyltransferase family 4 protein [Terriglobales bacterium]
MRILITSDAAGGVGVVSAELARALRARGHQVRLVVFDPAGAGGAARFRLEWMDDQGDGSALAAETERARAHLAAEARSFRPEVVHCNQFAFVGAVAGAASLLAVHSDVVSWWRGVKAALPPDTGYQRWYFQLARRALQHAAAVVAPTHAAAADVAASFGWTSPVRVIPNGCEAPTAAPTGVRSGAASVGRLWDQAKQFERLAEAARMARVEVRVAGDIRHPVSGRAAAPAQGLRWLGQLDREGVARLLASSQIYVGASCYEPFGLAALEAAHAGCALLLADIPSFREVWNDAATYFPSHDGRQLANALLGMLAAPAAGGAACARARRLYSAQAMATAYERVYAALA